MAQSDIRPFGAGGEKSFYWVKVSDSIGATGHLSLICVSEKSTVALAFVPLLGFLLGSRTIDPAQFLPDVGSAGAAPFLGSIAVFAGLILGVVETSSDFFLEAPGSEHLDWSAATGADRLSPDADRAIGGDLTAGQRT